jgi:hypothetical protein
MDRSITPEIPINVSSRHTLYPAFSNSLSNLPSSELPDTMPQTEKEIKNNMDEDGSDGEIDINDETGNTNTYRQSMDRHTRKRRKL